MKRKFSGLRARARTFTDANTGALLERLARDIDDRPEVLCPINAKLAGHLQALVAGVEVDLDQPLPPEVIDRDMH